MHTRDFTGFDGVRVVGDVRGSGPLVLFVHGFPELRQSWNRLARTVADAGYTSCTIDVRGYGDSNRPPRIEDYRMEAIVGDLDAVAATLSPGAPTILVGHDWGASIVWHAAMARPERFGAVAALSVPWSGRAAQPFNQTFTARFTARNRFFYQAYFQEPGRAEAELEADPARFLTAFYRSLSGDAADGDWPNDKPADARLLDGVRFSSVPPPWLEGDYFAHAVETFERTGFAGALNRYRNHAIDYDWAAQFDHTIHQPALFIGGQRDPAFRLGARDPIASMAQNVPQLQHAMLDGCGHWIQAERAPEVAALLSSWLAHAGTP